MRGAHVAREAQKRVARARRRERTATWGEQNRIESEHIEYIAAEPLRQNKTCLRFYSLRLLNIFDALRDEYRHAAA